MAKALNVGHREALYDLAQRLVRQTQDSSALDATYEACADMVGALVTAKYPPQDMAVLAKYNRAELDACIFISAGGSNYEPFHFRSGDNRIPARPSGHCNSRKPHLLSVDQEKVWDAWRAADMARAKAVVARDQDFKTLIYSARTFEELLALWPAAEALRERILGTSRALAVMSDEVVARIKADAATTATVGAN